MIPRLWWRIRGRPAEDAVYAVRVIGAAALAEGLLMVLPLPQVAQVMASGGVGIRLPPTGRMLRLTDRLLALNRGPLRPNCVIRSMVLLRYLRRTEGELSLVMGLRPEVRPVDGHAWLEREGAPFAEARDPHEDYVVTWRWP